VVNGEVTLAEGVHTGARAGQVLRGGCRADSRRR
jgi:hypothetical protein